MTALCVGLHLLLQFGAIGQSRMTAAEARKLVGAVLSANQKKLAKLVIEPDGEHDGCVVYHAYQSPGTMTFTVGWWSIDTRTAEVWDDLIRERVTEKRLVPVQLTIRKRLGVTNNELSASIFNPCYERDSK